ncbi:FAD-dependent monooxygenase [Actinophytocola sp. NPDC049390]|uniref:FAD-dependent monooxygenase n=1 Tax=Actinophytocola sp. NPDC049390 TaxID=3363894 RepID=UPI003791EFA4
MNRSVLISGAGIAGPSLAYWLGRHGDRVTVVEQAPGPRASGSAVDFRGDQLALLTRMGVLEKIREAQTGMGDQVIVNAAGRRRSAYPAAVFSGEVEIDRADLARILHDHSAPHAEYVFGDRVTAMTQHADGVDVTFARGAARRYDIVVGADGLHSAVRGLTFGAGHTHYLGYHAASFEVANTFGLDHSGVIHNAPNRYVGVASARDAGRAIVSLMFATPEPAYRRDDLDGQKSLLARHFADVGWRTPELLAALRDVTELYFAPLSQVRLDRWSSGRVVLLGDAAWCAGPGGNGTGHAMLGAYTLAGELARAGHETAFARYEEVMRPPVTKSQKFAAGAGKHLAPPTEKAIRRRDRTFRVLSSRPMTGLLTWLSTRTADTGELTDYPLPAVTG